jgi:NAD-dependent dihydropyrimidine dehydrogenase PreA subunit
MKAHDFFSNLRDTALRLFPYRAPTGLVRIGDPGPESPVLVTGNFTLTVRRLRRVLDRTDVWLLVANSKGINVWCAAGGGHFTHHDVISVVRSSRISDLVTRRDLILPQLAATGVERRTIEEAIGWTTRWGPARLEDLPAVLARGGSVRGRERWMRFPLWERLEMASVWYLPMILTAGPVLAVIAGWKVALSAVALILFTVTGLFAAEPRLKLTGPGRWITYGWSALIGAAVGIGMLALLGSAGGRDAAVVAAASLLAMLILSVDLAGTTPDHASTVNTRNGMPQISLDTERCTGAADCVAVCPCEVLHLKGRPPRAVIADGEACIACAACIVQCPEDALFFTFPDGRIVEPATIRRTRLNMLGDRSVEVHEARHATRG